MGFQIAAVPSCLEINAPNCRLPFFVAPNQKGAEHTLCAFDET